MSIPTVCPARPALQDLAVVDRDRNMMLRQLEIGKGKLAVIRRVQAEEKRLLEEAANKFRAAEARGFVKKKANRRMAQRKEMRQTARLFFLDDGTGAP